LANEARIENLISLPLPVLHRIVSKLTFEVHEEDYCRFVMRVLKLRGGISSLLFEFVDFERLKQEEFRILEAMADFKWIFVHDSIRRTFSSLLDSHLEQNSLIAVLKIEFSRCLKEIDGLKSNILSLEERLASLSVSGSLREDERTRKMANLENRLDLCDSRSQQ
jgi:hypothetical protein